jgi:hypothetical protein
MDQITDAASAVAVAAAAAANTLARSAEAQIGDHDCYTYTP